MLSEPSEHPRVTIPHQAVDDDPLTPAQREFAVLLGRLLADRWIRAQGKTLKSEPANLSDTST